MRQHDDITSDSTTKVTVVQAAEILGLTEGAVRQRLKRGTLPFEKAEDGSVYVLLHRTHARTDADNTRTNTDSTNDNTADQVLSPLVESLEDQVQFLREQLAAEREANRENRRLLAAALDRIPELEPAREATPEASESPGTATDSPDEYKEAPDKDPDKERHSWLYRFFFGP